MPKSSRKKKEKASDFTKAKLKLGKGKQAPSNAIDTSFKARSIALPTQSIVLDKSGEAPTTKRKLTFDDLTSHLKHYNATTRRDAILGLKELLEAHPHLIIRNLTALVHSCVRLISDEDASVRKALLSFFGWLFHQIPSDDVVPHASVLLLFTTSAQTHIFPEIRIDAIRLLDLFLEVIPQVVTEGWSESGSGHGRRVLEGYLGVLNAGTAFGEAGDAGPVQATSTASVVLSPMSKLVVMKSLSSFLRHALSSRSSSGSHPSSSSASSSTPTWFLASYFHSSRAFESFDSILHSTYHNAQSTHSTRVAESWTENADTDSFFEDFSGHFDFATSSIGPAWSLQELTSAEIHGDVRSVDETHAAILSARHLARTLHSTLVSTFLDCAPTVFSPSSMPPETELQMVLVIGEISRSLYSAILCEPVEEINPRNTAVEDLKQILGYLSPYFPFTVGGSAVTKRDVKAEQSYQDLSLIFCELTSFLILASSDDPASAQSHTRSKSHRSRPSTSSPPLPIARVSEFVVRLLRGEPPRGSSQTSLARPITPAAYSALLPTIWSLLNSHGQATDGRTSTPPDVLRVVAEHATKASSMSAVKRSTVDFLGRLVLLDREAEYRGAFRVGRDPGEDRWLQDWVLHLPKTLWELGSGGLPTTETILRLLLRLAQRGSPLLREEVLSQLRTRLVPYFIIDHPTKGRLPGPFAKIPPASPARRLVLDVASILLAKVSGEDGLAIAVEEATRATDDESYWTAVRGS